MKKKNAIIGALVITLLFGLAMGAMGLNAIANPNGVAVNNPSSSITVRIILSTPATGGSSTTIQSAAPFRASGG